MGQRADCVHLQGVLVVARRLSRCQIHDGRPRWGYHRAVLAPFEREADGTWFPFLGLSKPYKVASVNSGFAYTAHCHTCGQSQALSKRVV